MEQRLEWEARSQSSSTIVQRGGGVFFSLGGKGKVALCTIQHFQALKYHADVLYISAACHPQVPS